jgi:uncharacterized membrane protein YfcA
LEPFELLLIVLIAFITACISGVTGVAGGLLPAIFLTPIVGITTIMPVLGVMLTIGSFSRSWVNRVDFHSEVFFRITLPALPMVVVGGLTYAQLEANAIALLLGSVVLISIPLRRWAKSKSVKTSPLTLSCIGGVFGFLAGSAVGPGMLLIPFMLGYGLSRTSFVATMAVIATLTNATRVVTYGSVGLMTQEIILVGLLAGAATLPGNIIGRRFLRGMNNNSHGILVDIMTVIGGVNFIWIGLS